MSHLTTTARGGVDPCGGGGSGSGNIAKEDMSGVVTGWESGALDGGGQGLLESGPPTPSLE